MQAAKDFARVLDSLRFGGWWRASSREDNPTVGGHFSSVMRERGKIVPGSRREGSNIWTMTGREFIVEAITLASLSPATKTRDDALLYFGLGNGSQPEVAEVSRLAGPIEFAIGEFLAPTQVPASFPSAALGTARTSVRLTREYGEAELSLGAPVVITEFGCFTNGDPALNNAVGRPTDLATAGTQAPVGYKSFEPFTKTTNRTVEVVYELRVV